jgi:hypothetical protein
MEVIRFSGTSVHIRTVRRYVLEDGKFRNYRCENLKSYILYFDYSRYWMLPVVDTTMFKLSNDYSLTGPHPLVGRAANRNVVT